MQATVARSLMEATKTETDLAALECGIGRRVIATPPCVQPRSPLIERPPYAPERNPAERVFEELRAGIEGIVYPTIEAKVEAVEAILHDLDANPARVRILTSWHWITETLAHLSTGNAA